MALPWRRSRERRAPDTTTEARAALARAQSEQRRVAREWPRINRVADDLTREREANHFSARFAIAFGHTPDA